MFVLFDTVMVLNCCLFFGGVGLVLACLGPNPGVFLQCSLPDYSVIDFKCWIKASWCVAFSCLLLWAWSKVCWMQWTDANSSEFLDQALKLLFHPGISVNKILVVKIFILSLLSRLPFNPLSTYCFAFPLNSYIVFQFTTFSYTSSLVSVRIRIINLCYVCVEGEKSQDKRSQLLAIRAVSISVVPDSLEGKLTGNFSSGYILYWRFPGRVRKA